MMSKDNGIYLYLFTDRQNVVEHFDAAELADNANILLAYYECEDYDGYAYVLYEQEGKLYEVHGGHCSCYGLEGQWEPEEVTIEYLSLPSSVPSLGGAEFKRIVKGLSNEQG